MKKILKALLIILVVLVIGVTAIYAYFGGFKSIKIEVKEAGGEIFVYENVTGDYSQSPLVMDSIYYSLIDYYKIETTKGAGIYYDNPQYKDKSHLRSEVGCIIDIPLDSLKMAELSQKYKVKILPKTTYLTTEFPHKGMLSVMVGIMKVYPAITKYSEENGFKDSPVMEIYNMPSKTIFYRTEAIK